MDVELRYWPHNKPIPEGWERHDGLDGSHHGPRTDGTGYTFIVKKQTIILCSCGHPLCKQEPVNGHYQGTVCKQIQQSCCGDF